MKPGLAASLRLDAARVERDTFLESYRAGVEALARNYARLLQNPGEKQVHDARTATRKTEAHLALLPRKLRVKGSTRQLEEAYREVMEKSAKLRDLDILTAKLLGLEGASDLVEGVAKSRRRAERPVERAITSASELEVPSLRRKDVPRGGLERRFEKVVGRLTADCDALLPEVLRDPSDMKDLHRLRIHLKRVRYLLEAAAPGASEALSALESIQDALGSIHDWDVSIAYVRRASPGWELLPGWVAQRENEFKKLVGLLSSAGLA